MRVRIPSMPASWHIKPRTKTSKAILHYGAPIIVVILCIVLVLSVIHSFTRPRVRASVVAVQSALNEADLHYGIVVDAGSSGSRIFVYKWPPHNGNPAALLEISSLKDLNDEAVIKKIEPGLSSFGAAPQNTTVYIQPLLDYAAEHIPKEKHKETPLYILATAGMRLLSTKQQTAILQTLRHEIPKRYQFQFAETHVEVISGKQEGVYQWMSINYILGRFEHTDYKIGDLIMTPPPPSATSLHRSRKRTVGIIDMGGGSVQVAYEIQDTTGLSQDVVAEVNLGCQDHYTEHMYRIYVTTFLSFGANEARKRYEQQLLEKRLRTNGTLGLTAKRAIRDPCLPLNKADTVKLHGNRTGNAGKEYYIKGTGDFNLCQKSLLPLLNLTVPCDNAPCSFNGVHQPYIDFKHGEFYGFSEFWYSMEDVLRLGGLYQAETFEKSAAKYCATEWSLLKKWYSDRLYPKADDARFYMQCFKSAWMSVVLHQGFKFPRDYEHFQSVQSVNGEQVPWTLGALLYRTRFLPLRSIEQPVLHKHKVANSDTLLRDIYSNSYILVFCFLVVLAAIVLYVRHLRGYVRIHKVPSLSYLMVPQDEVDVELGYSEQYPGLLSVTSQAPSKFTL